MSPEQDDPPPFTDDDFVEPELADLAAAVLDGAAIDWAKVARGNQACYLDELRAVADLIAIHRSRTEPEETPDISHPSDATRELGTWGPLRLIERIGQGAFGDVFRAWDSRLDRQVALKLIRPASTTTADRSNTAISEGRLLARIRHPNVVTVFGAERIDGQVGIWTEWIEGGTLASLVQQHGPFTADEAMSIGIDLCGALTAVHQAGLIHCDVKAQNVLRESGGRIVLVDLGTGRELLHDRGTEAKEVSGTPLYMAPELWTGEQPTSRSDIYSLGVLLYYLVTGTYPVRGTTAEEVRQAHAEGRRVPLRIEKPDLPAAFVNAVEHAIEPDASRRFAQADAFGAALEQARTPRRHRRRVAMVTLATAILAAAGAIVWRFAASGGPQTETRVRVNIAAPAILGRPSRDGRFVPYANADIWLLERATGKLYRVTTKLPKESGGTFSAASPDGSWVAYEWRTETGSAELRLSHRDRGDSRTLLPSSTAISFQPLEWSRDGKTILCWLQQVDGRRDLALIRVDGGPHRILISAHDLTLSSPSLSADGKFIIYDRVQGPADHRRDIFIAAADGTGERLLAPHAAHDRNPLWAPDGNILFLSDRLRRDNLYSLPMEGGVPGGDPVVVAQDLAAMDTFAVSDAGEYFYRHSDTDAEVFVASLDFSGATPVGTPSPMPAEKAGAHVGGNWSPTGDRFIYIDRALNALEVRTLRTGSTDIVRPRLFFLGNAVPRWSPDENWVLVRGQDWNNREGFFRVGLSTGQTVPAVIFGAPGDVGNPFEWSDDGGHVNYWHAPRGIVARDLESGKEHVVADRAALQASTEAAVLFASSRHGQLAASVPVGRDQEQVLVVKVRSGASPFREVTRVPSPRGSTLARFQGWSPDGKLLMFVRRVSVNAPFHLMAIAADGGPWRDLGALPGFMTANPFVAIRPGGQQLAYTQGQVAYSMWVLGHFLPPAPLERKR